MRAGRPADSPERASMQAGRLIGPNCLLVRRDRSAVSECVWSRWFETVSGGQSKQRGRIFALLVFVKMGACKKAASKGPAKATVWASGWRGRAEDELDEFG